MWRPWRCLAVLVLACALLPTTTSASGLDGRRLYQTHCASCHGPDARGDGPDAEAFVQRPRDLRAGVLKTYPTDALVRRIRAGAPLQLALDPAALKARAGEVNVLVEYLRKLPTIDWKRTAEGRVIYTDRCTACHGPYGADAKHLPPGVRPPRDLSDPAFQNSIGDKELATVVRHGRKAMPALVPHVPQTAAPPLVAFVRLLSPGFELYSRYCASCHGDDGLGMGKSLGRVGVPDVRFDHRYFAQHDADRLHIAVWHMIGNETPTMPHYRRALSDAEARAIVNYLQRLD